MSHKLADIKEGGLYKTENGKPTRVEGTKPGGIGNSAAAKQKPRKAKAKAKPKAKAKAAPAAKSSKPKGGK